MKFIKLVIRIIAFLITWQAQAVLQNTLNAPALNKVKNICEKIQADIETLEREEVELRTKLYGPGPIKPLSLHIDKEEDEWADVAQEPKKPSQPSKQDQDLIDQITSIRKKIAAASHICKLVLYPAVKPTNKNYYKIIGTDNFASTDAIRRGCTIKQTEIKTKLEPAALDLINELYGFFDPARNGYKFNVPDKKIKELQSGAEVIALKIYDINQACEVLQDKAKKAEHDKNLPAEHTYVSTQEMQRKCLPLEEKVVDLIMGGKTLSEAEIDDIMLDCPRPKKWPRRSDNKEIFLQERRKFYGAELSKFEKPKEEKEVELTGIRKKIEIARASNLDVKMSSLVGNMLSTIPIPDVGGKVFGQDLAMKDLTFVPSPYSADVRQGIGFTGTMQINKFDMKGTVFVVEKTNHAFGCSLSIALPTNYKISDIIPQFKKLDTLSLPKVKLVLSNFNYTDPDGYSIKYGLNLAASLDLSGPLKMLSTLKDKAKELKSIIVRSDPILFQGVIPVDLTKTELSAVIPLRIGIDFTKIPKMPKSITDIFKEFTTDDFRFAVLPPPTMSFTIEGGVRLVLGTQPAPLSFILGADLTKTNLTLSVRMKNMLELKYFALGNAGVQLDFDEELMPAAALLGIPFTGIGVNGELDLGTVGDKRVNLQVAAAARVTSSSIPDIVFEAQASNLQFANLLYLYNSITKKMGVGGQIPETKIPIMNINKVGGYMALDDVKVAGKTYYAGFKLNFDAQLFDKTFGFDFDLRHKALTCSGSAYMPVVDLVLEGKRVFTLSDSGGGDRGPNVYFNFNARNIPGSVFGIKAMLDVPPIDLKNSIELEYAAGGFIGHVDMTYAGFTALFDCDFNPKAPKEMRIRFGFKGDFEKFLSEQALPALNTLSDRANRDLAKLDAAMGDLSRDLGELRSNAVNKTDKEIQKTRDTIKNIEQKIDTLKNECNKASKLKKLYICSKNGLEIAAQGTALAAQKGYLEGLLKPGKEVIKSGKTIEQLTAAISKAEVSRKTIGGILLGTSKAVEGLAKGLSIFKITHLVGEVSGIDLAAGKLPRLVSLEVEINIPDMDPIKVSLSNLQFDFKNPKESAMNIVQQLLEGIKTGDMI